MNADQDHLATRSLRSVQAPHANRRELKEQLQEKDNEKFAQK